MRPDGPIPFAGTPNGIAGAPGRGTSSSTVGARQAPERPVTCVDWGRGHRGSPRLEIAQWAADACRGTGASNPRSAKQKQPRGASKSFCGHRGARPPGPIYARPRSVWISLEKNFPGDNLAYAKSADPPKIAPGQSGASARPGRAGTRDPPTLPEPPPFLTRAGPRMSGGALRPSCTPWAC